jgi:hypothetical protein
MNNHVGGGMDGDLDERKTKIKQMQKEQAVALEGQMRDNALRVKGEKDKREREELMEVRVYIYVYLFLYISIFIY